MKFFKLLAFGFLLTLASCGKDCTDPTSNPNNPLSPINNPTATCDTSHYPIVFVHGTLASSDTWTQQVMRFESNGYCGSRIYGFDYYSLSFGGGGGGNVVTDLDTYIDQVLQETGASKVELVGHSQGGTHGYNYCSVAARAAKVAHYVHVGASSQTKPAGPNGEIPTLNVSSLEDAVAGNTTITGANNTSLTNKDHYQVATCVEAFEAMYRFFNNDVAPKTLQITPQSNPKLSGRAVVLGDNTALAGATVKVYEVAANSGARLSGSPDFVLTTDAKGYFAPITVKPSTHYEFEIKSTDPTDRVIHYYREGFIHSDKLVYLRIIPKTGTGALLTNNLPKNDNQTVLAVFTANQAVVNGRDSLTASGNELSSAALSPASATNIAFFLYDDGDGTTEMTQDALYASFPFIAQADVFFPTTPVGSIPLRFNGRNQFVQNLKSNTDGVIVVVFD